MVKRIIVLGMLLLAFLCPAMEAGACTAQQQFPIGLNLQYTVEESSSGEPTSRYTYDFQVVGWMQGVGYPVAEARYRAGSDPWFNVYFDVSTWQIYDSNGQPTSDYLNPFWIDLSDPLDGIIEWRTSSGYIFQLNATGGHTVTVPAGTYVCWRGYHLDTTSVAYFSWEYMFESSYGLWVKEQQTYGPLAPYQGPTTSVLIELSSSNMNSFIPLALLRAIPIIASVVVIVGVVVVVLVVLRRSAKKRRARGT